MKYLSIIAICMAALPSQPLLASTAPAGKVVFSTGNNTVTSSTGERRTINQGDIVKSGDRLQTDSGRLQVRFTDNGFVSLKPGSQMVINEYAFNGKEDGTEKAFFSLVKGSLRAVTGVIGKRDKKAYKYDTPVATIGIRGTAFALNFCNKDCFAADGSPLPDGLYVNNGEGRVYIENEEGVIDLVRGQFAFVKDIKSEPQQIMQPPAMQEMFREEAENSDSDYRVAENEIEDIRNDPELPDLVELVELDEMQALTFTLVGDGVKSSNPAISGSGTRIRTESDGAVERFEYFDPQLQALVRFDSDDARLIMARSGSNTILDASWGIWEGGYSYVNQDSGTSLESNPRYLAYMGFANPTDLERLPTNGTAEFSVQLDPRANGAVNVMTGAQSASFMANIGVNWETAMFTNFDLDAIFTDGSSFDMRMQGTNQAINGSGVPLTGTFSGAFATGGANFQFANDASAIGGTFHVGNSDGMVSAVGTFLLGDESVEIIEPLPDRIGL